MYKTGTIFLKKNVNQVFKVEKEADDQNWVVLKPIEGSWEEHVGPDSIAKNWLIELPDVDTHKIDELHGFDCYGEYY